MAQTPQFDAIIVGGSYAGLSAAMALGRSHRKVLILDSGKPCNRQTPHSHNFLTQDGNTPARIAATAKEQVLQYPTVQFHQGLATGQRSTGSSFQISTEAGEVFSGKKLLFATGVADELPPIKGLAECWGISVLHCPYCHGYEVSQQPLGLLGNGDFGFEFARLLHNWSRDITLFTNGPATFSPEQEAKLRERHIRIVEGELQELVHEQGQLRQVLQKDGTRHQLTALFAKPGLRQHTELPMQLGCAHTEMGFIQVDAFQRTTVPGVYAAGDNTTMFRTLSTAVAAGTMAGAMLNKELVEEEF